MKIHIYGIRSGAKKIGEVETDLPLPRKDDVIWYQNKAATVVMVDFDYDKGEVSITINR